MELPNSNHDSSSTARSTWARPPVLVGISVWAIAMPLAHGVLPWGISWLGPRYGWTDAGPGIANLWGLLPVVAGVAGLLWALAPHFARCREWEFASTPSYLAVSGPYQLTRNPIYVAELTAWVGWSLFYGSAVVFISSIVLAALMSSIAVPLEERALAARFGEIYRQYVQTVPRWLGRRRAS